MGIRGAIGDVVERVGKATDRLVTWAMIEGSNPWCIVKTFGLATVVVGLVGGTIFSAMEFGALATGLVAAGVIGGGIVAPLALGSNHEQKAYARIACRGESEMDDIASVVFPRIAATKGFDGTQCKASQGAAVGLPDSPGGAVASNSANACAENHDIAYCTADTVNALVHDSPGVVGWRAVANRPTKAVPPDASPQKGVATSIAAKRHRNHRHSL